MCAPTQRGRSHRLAQTVKRRGEASHPSVKYAHSLVSEAIKLALWLHDQQLELSDLHQDLADEWVGAGSRIRRRVRLSSRGFDAPA